MNYSHVLNQLAQAKQNCIMTIEAMEKASERDGVDRSGSIASVKRDLASYEKQHEKFSALHNPPQPQPAEKKKK